MNEFQYRGSIITDDSDVEIDIRKRIGQATTVFKKLDKISKSNKMSLKIKLRLYSSIVLSTAIFAFETSVKLDKELNAFNQRYFRKILKIKYLDRVKNEEILTRTRCKNLTEIITELRFKMDGHSLLRPDTRHLKL